MKLMIISTGAFKVFAACSDDGRCHLLRFLDDLEGPARMDAHRMLRMLKRVSLEGLPARYEINHRLAEGISQLRQGRIRVLYFCDRDRIIVCTHGFIKRSQKTPAGEIGRALDIWSRYREEKTSGAIEVIREENP
jgi:phage-related protein